MITKKTYCVVVSFMKIRAHFYPHFPYLLSALGEIWYKKSPPNAVEHL